MSGTTTTTTTTTQPDKNCVAKCIGSMTELLYALCFSGLGKLRPSNKTDSSKNPPNPVNHTKYINLTLLLLYLLQVKERFVMVRRIRQSLIETPLW